MYLNAKRFHKKWFAKYKEVVMKIHSRTFLTILAKKFGKALMVVVAVMAGLMISIQ